MEDNLKQLYDALHAKNVVSGSIEDFSAWLSNDNNRRALYDKMYEKKAVTGTFEDFTAWTGIAPKRMTAQDVENQNKDNAITFDRNTTSFDDWYQTVPADRNDTTNYNLRRAYELAPMEELEAWRTATPEELEKGEKHLHSVYENEKGEYEFMKSKNHPTLKMELDEYKKNDEFRRNHKLDTSGEYYKYVDRGINLEDMSFANYKKNEERLMSISKEIEEATDADISDFDIENMRAHAADPNHIADLEYERALLQDYIKRAVVSDEYAQSVRQIHQLTDEYRAKNGIGRGEWMNKSRLSQLGHNVAPGIMGITLGITSAQNAPYAAADFVIYGIEQQTKRSEKRIEDYNNGKKGVFSDFGRGFVTTNWNALDPLQTLNLAEQSFKIARKFNDDGTLKDGESLTDGEQKLLDALVIARAADSTLIDTMWERVGANTMEQLKYTLEFILTSELAGARLMSGGAAKAVTKKIENATMKKITHKVIDYAIQPTLQTAFNPLNLYQNTLERMTGEVVIDGNGEFAGFKGGEEAWPAFRDAFVAAYIENFSEKIGEDIFKPLTYGNKALRNMDNAFGRAYNQLATKIDVAIENAGVSKIGDAFKISKDLRLATGIQGVPGEYMEEIVGGLMNSMFVGDQSWHKYDENGNENPNYLWNSEQQLETFLSCAVMSLGMTAFSNARNGVVAAADRRNAKSYLDAATKAMRNHGFDVDAIDEAFENGTLKDASQKLFIMGAAENVTDNKRQILSNYIAAKINYAAMRNADMGALEEQFKVIEDEARASVNAETKDRDGNGGRIIQVNVEGNNGEMLEGVAVVSGKVLTRIETDANGNDMMVLDRKGSSSVLYVRVPGEAKPRAIYSSQVKGIVAATNVDEYIEKQKNMLTGTMTDMFGAQYEDGLPLEQLIMECAVLSNKEMQIGKTSVSLEKGRKYHVFDNRSGKIVEAAFVEDTQMDGEQYHVFNINGENMGMTDSELKESMLRYRLQLAEESGAKDEAAQIELDALLRERDADMATRPVSEDQMIETVVSSEAAMDENGNFTADSNPKAVAVAVLKSCGYDLEKAIASLQKSIDGLAAQTAQNVVSQQSGETASPSLEENVANANAVSDGTIANAGIIGMYQQAIEEAKLYMQNFVGEPEIGETYTIVANRSMIDVVFDGFAEDGKVKYHAADSNLTVTVPRETFDRQRAEYVKWANDAENAENGGDNNEEVVDDENGEPIEEDTEEPQPVGTGSFGNIYDQFRGKAKEAVAFLKKKKSGEATGALSHRSVGEIDLVWGEEGTGKSDGFGLAKLVKYHPEVVDHLQELLDEMEVVSRTANRVNLESKTHKAGVRLDWDGERKTWLMTMFEKKGTSEPANGTTDITGNQSGMENDTAPFQNPDDSTGKDNTNINTPEQKNENISEKLSAFIQKYGDKAAHKIDVTVADREAVLEKARKDLEKAQQAYDEAPIGKEEKAEKALEKAQQAYNDALADKQLWDEVKAVKDRMAAEQLAEQIEAQKQTETPTGNVEEQQPKKDAKTKVVKPKDSQAFEKRVSQAIYEMGDATSFDDEVLRRLAMSTHKFKWGSDGTHKGMGAMLGFKGGGEEMTSRAMFLNKNGKYFDDIALDIWQDLPESYQEQHSDQDVRDLMIDYLRLYPNPFAMVDAIRKMQNGAKKGETIEDAADRQREDELESIAESYGMSIDEFNKAVYDAAVLDMSLDEYLAMKYVKEEFLKEKELSDEDYEKYNNFAAEQILTEEQGEQYGTGRIESDSELHQGETESTQQGGMPETGSERDGTESERGSLGEEREIQRERDAHGTDKLSDKRVATEPYTPRSQRGKDRAVELDNEIAAQKERLASAQKEYDKAVSDFNKRNGLFGDTEHNDDTLFGDLADFSNENFERISKEKQTSIENEQKKLDELVSRRDKELQDIDEAVDKQTALFNAEQETDTNPTEAQKKAGNYKKGHVTIDGFDISIENPRGSVRSGKDANGKEWSVTMHDSYGYIRMTESVDGDHIDIFLSDHLDNWNGSVFVVDQVKPDGSFDEHKVMYGFDTVEEATAAYLANYSEGWRGLGKITYVSKRGFKKWIDSSHRKTKPFAEYKEILLSRQKEESKRVFKEDEKDRRLEALRRRHGSQLNININPQDLEDLLYVAGYHIENGVRKFADFCKGMITDLGDWVRPYLKQIYSACKYDEDIAKLNVPFEEWTDDREVSTFDVANFDKETADLAQTGLARNEKALEQLKQRNGKAFEYSEELEKSRKRLEEYTEAIKKEMEEKEKKYAEMDAEVEAADNLIEAEEAEEATSEESERLSVEENEDTDNTNTSDIAFNAVIFNYKITHTHKYVELIRYYFRKEDKVSFL